MKRQTKTQKNQIEIISDKRTVWINDSLGCCIGRFTAGRAAYTGGNAMIDVHRSSEAQLNGEPECLDCGHDLPLDAAWERFKKSMWTFHQVIVGDEHKPEANRRDIG